MEGIAKIIDRIKADSEAECAAIAAEGAAKCDEIKTELKKLEDQKYGEAMSKGAAEAAARFERLKNVAELEAKKQLLAEKQALVEEAFALAAEKLKTLSEDDYVVLLARLAGSAAITGEEQLIFSKNDREKVGQSVVAAANMLLADKGRTAKLALSGETRDINGGVIISGGDIETNCSVEALVAQYKNELSPRVAGILFE